ncbi:epithelial membrane protein 1-like [Dysidea avara]|uniref:epithelial membrane protein 1-like n=1 Tax=Dysidea avara TaxID=196820 RepID=UPI0033285314
MSWEEHSEKLRRLWEVFLVFTSGIFLLMCFGTPYWLVDSSDFSDKRIKMHAGLWACCYETDTTQTCYRNTPANCDIAGHVIATQILVCLAFISGLSACVVAMVSVFKWRKYTLVAAMMCFASQAFWLLLGLSIYSKSFKQEKVHHSWSYTLGWVSFSLSITCAVYYLITGLLYLRNGPSKIIISRDEGDYARLQQWEDEDSDD